MAPSDTLDPAPEALAAMRSGAIDAPDSEALEEAWASAFRAWPEVAISVTDFSRRVSELSLPAPPPRENLSDVYLAWGCAQGDPSAVRACMRHFAPHIAQPIARVSSNRTFCEDATQLVHEKLFVRHEDVPPRIADYDGQVPLRNWLRVVARRTALNLARGAATNTPTVDESRADLLAAAEVAPELRYMMALYKEHFEEATRIAFRALSPRERTLLRLHLAGRMTLVQLGAVYDVSHATAARWLTAVRDKLGTAVRQLLTDRLTLTMSEFDGLADLVRSQLDVRVLDLLRSTSSR